ncbi:hypothetical protein PDN50_22855 [Bacillus cereus]|nr:hypothetical protein [Bacillus cereus]MDA2445388.1 hypothetical protein [Bacillus cereus]HDR4481008.1 hypothetical protein [Bacillus cereus]
MAYTLHTWIIKSFLEQGGKINQVQITVEEVDNTIPRKNLINEVSQEMDVTVFTATIEEIIDNLEAEFPSASIKVVDENKSIILNENNTNILASKDFIVRFKFLSR